MTDDEINIALAMIRGWTAHATEDKQCYDPEGLLCYCSDIPDHLNGIEALGHIAEVEKLLTLYPFWAYADTLKSMSGYRGLGVDEYILASPRQRAEALLRTLGKWKQ